MPKALLFAFPGYGKAYTGITLARIFLRRFGTLLQRDICFVVECEYLPKPFHFKDPRIFNLPIDTIFKYPPTQTLFCLNG